MALSANINPSQVKTYSGPYDDATAFASTQTIVSSGYLNNRNSGLLDLGAPNPTSAAGRTEGMWCMDITAMNFATADETYQFALLGSNDVAFGNGNVELLAFHDFAAVTAGRIIATLLGATPAIPPPFRAGTILQFPFTNLVQLIYYRYLKCFATLGGTSPSCIVTCWIGNSGEKF
jgi:hypothetical protein